jgi:hypothetical protein
MTATSRMTPAGRRSIVATGADVLRRALAHDAQPHHQSAAPAHSVAPWQVGDAGLRPAPATRGARDVIHPVGTEPVRRMPTRNADELADPTVGTTPGPAGAATAGPDAGAASHVERAAGRPRSEAGAALAERFMTELSRTVRARSAPLPTTFRPLADRIAGRRAVALSTDATSRRALRSVGKRAATVGDTIHLDVSAQQMVAPSTRLTEVVAHELTHVAHPSPAPRFFDDIDESPEERRAETVARVISRAPVAPTNSTLTAPFAPPRPAPAIPLRRAHGGRDVIRRELTDTDTDDRPLSVAELTERFGGRTPTRTGSPGSPRTKESTVPSSTAPTAPSTGDNGTSQAPTGAASVAALLDTEEARSWFAGELDRNSHRIVERLEDIVAAQLERRGGRFRGGF